MTDIDNKPLSDKESPKKGGCGTGVLLLLLSLLGGGAFLGYHLAISRISWAAVEERVGSEFPHVPSMNVDELKTILDDDNKTDPILLDARKPEEWEVSRLPGARFLGIKADWAKNITDIPKDFPIVVYCSVGYRSAVMADLLMEDGYTDVTNLMGGIFAWANTDKTVFNDEGPTDGVHRYNGIWGRLLKKEFRKQ